jgi:hypothetical protein
MNIESHPDYITVTSGIRGYFSVHMKWNIDLNFYEPWNTSSLSFQQSEGAVKDGKSWALNEGIEFRY